MTQSREHPRTGRPVRGHSGCAGTAQAKYNTPGRLPPFARTITDAKLPANVSLWLVAGEYAWDEAKRIRDQGRALAMLPPGDNPGRYRWDFLAGHDPVLLVRAGEAAGHEVRALVEAVMAAGVGRVLDLGTMDRFVRGDACRT